MADQRIANNSVDSAPESGVAKRDAHEPTARELAIAGLRQFADFLDAHPTVETREQRFLIYVESREELADYARLTTWEKVYESNDWFMLRKRFGRGAVLEVYTDRSKVCRKVVKGTRLVPPQPATDAYEEEIVEWVCDDASLLAGGAR
jgi:hypothetical protein